MVSLFSSRIRRLYSELGLYADFFLDLLLHLVVGERINDPVPGVHRTRTSQSAPRTSLAPSVLNSLSITNSKVFPSSSVARLRNLPSSSRYSASTRRIGRASCRE